MAHPTPIKVLLATTLQPLAMELSGSLAHGAKLVDQVLHQEPTPQRMMQFERELSDLLREVGRRIVSWVVNRLEPERDSEAPSRVEFKGRGYRRRRKYRRQIASLFGEIELWRRLYEPLERGARSIHPLELRLGLEAGLATPALGVIALLPRLTPRLADEIHWVSNSPTALAWVSWPDSADAPHSIRH